MSDKDGVVLDFFAGSGTTAQAVLDQNKEDGGTRQFVVCEQLDYAETVTAKRVKKVIENNDEGDFVYMELAKWNEEWIEKIEKAKTGKELAKLWNEMKDTAFLSYKVDPKTIDANTKYFADLSVADQKKFLIECLDKNQLYVNLSEIEDKEYEVSKEDKALNKDFYNGK
jgi:adenine-specific DNA-methyltransferase